MIPKHRIRVRQNKPFVCRKSPGKSCTSALPATPTICAHTRSPGSISQIWGASLLAGGPTSPADAACTVYPCTLCRHHYFPVNSLVFCPLAFKSTLSRAPVASRALCTVLSRPLMLGCSRSPRALWPRVLRRDARTFTQASLRTTLATWLYREMLNSMEAFGSNLVVEIGNTAIVGHGAKEATAQSQPSQLEIWMAVLMLDMKKKK